MLLIPKTWPDRNARRAGVGNAAADKRTVRLVQAIFSRAHTRCSCKNVAPRLGASIGLTGSDNSSAPNSLRALRDDQEPRPPKFIDQRSSQRLQGYFL
jgi:hypothetical protein